VLTKFGAALVRDYRAIEKAAASAAQRRLRLLESALQMPNPAKTAPRRKNSSRVRKR
jgi:molybdenum-dependent DNA-binding transcriptional regulator ModE